MEWLKDDSSDTLEKIKTTFKEKRDETQWSYHELVADIYASSEEWNSDIKELEHILKSIWAKAKEAWMELWMELKEKINDQ